MIIIVGISKKSKYMKTVLSAEMGEGVMVQAKTGQSPVSSSSGGDGIRRVQKLRRGLVNLKRQAGQ